jgi:sortase A
MTSYGAGSEQPRSGFHHRPARRFERGLRVLALMCMAAGLAVFLHIGYLIWDPGARQAQHRLASQLQRQWRRHPVQAITVRTGQPFAFIRIPKFGSHWRFAIVQGTSLAQLADGPGHVPGTQMPGQLGNFAVAAHDITAGNPFLHLRTLRRGDLVIVSTVNATYRYRVLTEHVVPYTDSSVLDPVPGHLDARPTKPLITLITCTPVTLSFTPWRIVVTGALASTSWK